MPDSHSHPSHPPLPAPESRTLPAHDAEADLAGLRCPLPVLRTKKALADLAPGQLLRVFSTDPDSQRDIPAFAKMAGHITEKIHPGQNNNGDNGHFFYVRKK